MPRPSPPPSHRKDLEDIKIQALTFRLMPMSILTRTLSFASKENQSLYVCKDWQEALQGGGSAKSLENGAVATMESP